jgi:hypothetical protein
VKRHFLIAWRLRNIDGRRNAFKYVFGRYPLADWEKALLAMPVKKSGPTGDRGRGRS